MMLLADWAEAINGKLYIQGGGWTQKPLGEPPLLSCALAVRLLLGWDEANTKHDLTIRLLTDDGDGVEAVEGQAVVIESQVEVGRPPGIRKGSELDAALCINIQGLPMKKGRFRFALEFRGEPVGTGATFDLI